MKVSYRFFSFLMVALLSGFGLVCTGHQSAFAATTSTKTLNGEVSGVMNDSIAIISKEDNGNGQEFEILFVVDETVHFIGKDSIKGFQAGDTILASYTETISINKEGLEVKDRKLLSIKFLQAAAVETAEPESASDPTLMSQ